MRNQLIGHQRPAEAISEHDNLGHAIPPRCSEHLFSGLAGSTVVIGNFLDAPRAGGFDLGQGTPRNIRQFCMASMLANAGAWPFVERRMRARMAAAILAVFLVQPVKAQQSFAVALTPVADQKAVFATVESRRIVPARARIGGTVAELAVKEGDQVKLGQVLAAVGDEKLALQLRSLDAQIAGLEAQLAQAKMDLARAEELFGRGAVPRTRLDEARTTFTVAGNALQARVAERSVVQQQLAEGAVLAPVAGRILKVRLTAGAVILPGEPVADIAEQNFVLRLRVPERHARFLKAGDTIRVDAGDSGESRPRFGTLQLVYPQIEEGRVVADASLQGLGDYFVGQRIRVWVSAGQRDAVVIPESLISTRFGVDYVKLRRGTGTIDVPVQRGRPQPRPDLADGIEILSGLNAGDVLVKP
ncbi:MAG: efflux RND transporter periplasmic adaptor subunit [Reyranellaceae bacterium]